MARHDRYRLFIAGQESKLSWGTYGEARRAADIAHDHVPYHEVRIRRPDEVIWPDRMVRERKEGR